MLGVIPANGLASDPAEEKVGGREGWGVILQVAECHGNWVNHWQL